LPANEVSACSSVDAAVDDDAEVALNSNTECVGAAVTATAWCEESKDVELASDNGTKRSFAAGLKEAVESLGAGLVTVTDEFTRDASSDVLETSWDAAAKVPDDEVLRTTHDGELSGLPSFKCSLDAELAAKWDDGKTFSLRFGTDEDLGRTRRAGCSLTSREGAADRCDRCRTGTLWCGLLVFIRGDASL
jgi:hypothetical protein